MTTVDTSACTNIIVGRNASADGSVLLAYCADNEGWLGTLTFTPAATHGPADVREVYDWDSYKYLGHINEVSKTYQVVGNMNGEACKKLLTDYCCQKGDEMIDRWRKLAFHLIVKFNDMVVRPTRPDGTFILDETGHATNVESPGVSEVFARGLIELTGDRYRDLTTDDPSTAIAPTRVSRRRPETNAIYLPSGVQVPHPLKGVNIRNGQKYINTGN